MTYVVGSKEHREAYNRIFRRPGWENELKAHREKSLALKKERAERVRGRMRSKNPNLAAPHVISDQIEVTSMIDGETYESRGEYYAHLKANDVRVVEPGEDKSSFERTRREQVDAAIRDGLEATIAETYEQLEQGYTPQAEDASATADGLEINHPVDTGDTFRW